MAADYRLNEEIREASARILIACESLTPHVPLSKAVRDGILFQHRRPLEQHRRFYQAVATYLEEALGALEARESQRVENTDPLADLPDMATKAKAQATRAPQDKH